MIFNSMFAMFSEQGEKNLRAVPDSVLRPMSTLLIDEFQDVGANTISWVRATFKEIERRGLEVRTLGAPAFASLMQWVMTGRASTGGMAVLRVS
ncbi:hypothetical protein [Pseudomonas fluorescens]|uniref:hypothetical protein n=1 Tax=Pseudomonas fluorescens TaxID=294 RepID=UPI003819647B